MSGQEIVVIDRVKLTEDGPMIDKLLLDKEEGKKQGEPNEVRLIIVAARNLPNTDVTPLSPNGISDPYVTVKMGVYKKKTAVVENSLNPIFEEKFYLDIDEDAPTEIKIKVMDKDVGMDDKLGETVIPLSTLTNQYVGRWYPLGKKKGEIYIAAKKIEERNKAQNKVVNKPMRGKWIVAVLCGLVFVFTFLAGVILHVFAALLEYITGKLVFVIVRAMTGFDISFDFLSVRPGSPLELCLSGVKIKNPHGGYKSPYFVHLERLDIHIRIEKLRAKIVKIDLARLDGMTVYMEKARSPLVPKPEELLNAWAFLGGSPLENKEGVQPVEEEKTVVVETEDSKLLPKAAMGIDFKFDLRTLVISDINLFIKDLIADLAGDKDGVTNPVNYKPLELDHILIEHDDFGNNPLWLGDLIHIIVPKILKKIPYTHLIGSSLSAAGGAFFDPGEAQKKINDSASSLTKSVTGIKTPHYGPSKMHFPKVKFPSLSNSSKKKKAAAAAAAAQETDVENPL